MSRFEGFVCFCFQVLDLKNNICYYVISSDLYKGSLNAGRIMTFDVPVLHHCWYVHVSKT